MTFKCAVCASAFACVFCVNDDAHLCAACDRETHKNSLSRRHKRVPVTNNTGQFGLGGSGQLQLDTVPSLPSELLLEVNLAKELAHFDEAEDVSGDLDALLSYEPGAPLDFGIDLDKLVRNDKLDFYANLEPCFQVPQQQPSLLLPWSPPARPSATGLMEHTENSCKSDAVVPVLPSMPANNKRMEALLMEPCSPGSPNNRVVTTGSPQHGSKKLTVSASPSKGGASAPVQTAGDPAPGTKPSWIPAPLNKPEPITTNAALSSVGHSASVVNGTQSRKHEREGEAPPRVSQPGLMSSQTDVPLLVPTASPPTIMDTRAAGQLRGFTGSSSNMAGLHQSIHSYVDTETRAEKLARYRAKKARRRFQKTIRYQTRKDYAEVRPRIKGRFVSPEEFAAWKAAQDCSMSVYRTQEEGVHIVPTA